MVQSSHMKLLIALVIIILFAPVIAFAAFVSGVNRVMTDIENM